MKLDLNAVEQHVRHVGALRKESVYWRIAAGSSGLVTLIFEDSQGALLDVAGVETFELAAYPSVRLVEGMLH